MFKICTLALSLLASLTISAATDFDWNITEFEGEGFVVVKFDDENAESEVKLNYYASTKHTTVQLFDYANCNTSETTTSTPGILTTGVYTEAERVSTTLEIPLNINQTAITDSSFFGGTAEARVIQVCIRIDLMANLNTTNPDFEESINFHETKLEIQVDMTKGFEVVGVSTDRTKATETNETASLDYSVLAFEIDDASATGAELTTRGTYTQGDFLTIGIITNGTGVEVEQIIQMNITGNTDYDSIKSDGEPSALTQRDCGVDITSNDYGAKKGCKVKTMLVSDFFDTAEPQDLTIKGVAVMKFVRARRLANIDARDLQEASSADDTFGLTVSLKPMNLGDYVETQDEDDIDMIDDSAATSTIVGGMVSFVVVIFSFFLM